MTPLLSRVVSEKKWWILPLLLLLAVNLVAYVAFVRPLARTSAGAGARASIAADARRAAERELAAVEARRTASRQVQSDLRRFHGQVLPGSMASARRVTYATLPALADEVGVNYRRRRTEVVRPEEGSRLHRLTTVMELQGSYGDLRTFIHEVERSLDFIVIDDVTLTALNPGEPLGLVITLSTYFPETSDEP